MTDPAAWHSASRSPEGAVWEAAQLIAVIPPVPSFLDVADVFADHGTDRRGRLGGGRNHSRPSAPRPYHPRPGRSGPAVTSLPRLVAMIVHEPPQPATEDRLVGARTYTSRGDWRWTDLMHFELAILVVTGSGR